MSVSSGAGHSMQFRGPVARLSLPVQVVPQRTRQQGTRHANPPAVHELSVSHQRVLNVAVLALVDVSVQASPPLPELSERNLILVVGGHVQEETPVPGGIVWGLTPWPLSHLVNLHGRVIFEVLLVPVVWFVLSCVRLGNEFVQHVLSVILFRFPFTRARNS